MPEAIRLQLSLLASDRKIQIEQLALLTKQSIEQNALEDLNDVLLELEQGKEQEIKTLCENYDSPLMQIADQLHLVNSKSQELKQLVELIKSQMDRSSRQLIEKVGRHVHMKRTRTNIEESLEIVNLCLIALEHTNQVQELLKSNHKVAAVQNLQDLQSMELNELKNIGMGALITQSINSLTNEITMATFQSIQQFFDSKQLKTHIEQIGLNAINLTQKQMEVWQSLVKEHRHLKYFRFNSPVEMAYRRSRTNYLTDSQLQVDLGPLCESEMVFEKLGKVVELRQFLESRFNAFSDEYLAVSSVEKLMLVLNKIVGFCLFGRVCSNLLPKSRPPKLVNDGWEKLAQNISEVVQQTLDQNSNINLLEERLGMVMSTLVNFEFNVSTFNNMFRGLLERVCKHEVETAHVEFQRVWRRERGQISCNDQQELDKLLNVVWFNEVLGDVGEFPFQVPFSEVYLIVCEHLRTLLRFSTSFLNYFQHEPGFVENTVMNAIDTLLGAVCEQMENVQVQEDRELMVQTSVDLQLMHFACSQIELSLAKLRGATGRRGQVNLVAKSLIADAAKSMETKIHVVVENSVKEIFRNGFEFDTDEVLESPSSTILEMTTYMLTMANTILKRLPPQTQKLTYFTLTENIGVAMCSALYDIPYNYTETGLNNFELDLKFLETSMSEIGHEARSLDTLVEARQTIELLRSADPLSELNDPTIRNRKYGRVSQQHMQQLMQKLNRRKSAPNSPEMQTSPRQGFMSSIMSNRTNK